MSNEYICHALGGLAYSCCRSNRSVVAEEYYEGCAGFPVQLLMKRQPMISLALLDGASCDHSCLALFRFTMQF